MYVINAIRSSPGLRAPKLPMSWLPCLPLGDGPPPAAAPALTAPTPRISFSLEDLSRKGQDLRDDRALGRARDIQERFPSGQLFPYFTKGPRTWSTLNDDDKALSDRTTGLRTTPIEQELYATVARSGGALCPELFLFTTDPASIRLHATRTAAWWVSRGPTAPTVCPLALPEFINLPGRVWTTDQLRAMFQGLKDGGAAGCLAWAYATSLSDVELIEKTIDQNWTPAFRAVFPS